jgi:hypothetical protein
MECALWIKKKEGCFADSVGPTLGHAVSERAGMGGCVLWRRFWSGGGEKMLWPPTCAVRILLTEAGTWGRMVSGWPTGQ